jgi:hypothetical protein
MWGDKELRCAVCDHRARKEKMTKWPEWTVVYNIVRPDNFFIGKGWEFFFDEEKAQHCYDELAGLGYVATKRPFHPNDKQHMNPIDLRMCEEEEKRFIQNCPKW